MLSRKNFQRLVVHFVVLLMITSCLVVSPKVGAVAPAWSTFFAYADIEEYATYNVPGSHGDLWPTAWAEDNYLYTINGDGMGFGSVNRDINVNRMTGDPYARNITGVCLNSNISQVWTAGNYNRKPTGMICVDGVLYCAVQDLNFDFDDAPAATICKSTNKGASWTWNSTAMFPGYKFTTIMFLDYGKNNQYGTDGYVYAYGIDNNWRDCYSGRVVSPTKLFLARVPKASIMTRSAWQFYTGDLNGNASWSSDINARTPVLQDDTLYYTNVVYNYNANDRRNTSVISQGSIVYNQPLNRYIYTSWSEYTFEFYESPTPFGPWKKFLSKNYGPYNSTWTATKCAGYSTTMPFKFISADGKTAWIQSNAFGLVNNYYYSLRKLVLQPYSATTATNVKNNNNLALPANAPGVVPFSWNFHFGNKSFMNNGNKAQNEDSWDGQAKTTDYWGYYYPKAYNMNKVVYTTGTMFGDGGWFNNIKVQVRQNFNWIDVSGVTVSPVYPNNNTAGTNRSYTFLFADTWGDAVRVVGAPGGTACFTSIGELEVYYVDNGTTPTTTIIDNDGGAPGFTTTGTWSSSGNPGYNGGTYKYVSAGANATAVWTLNVPSAATYKVSVIYKAGTNRAASAKYNIATAAGTQSVYVNQTTNDLTWVTLGTWSFNAGNATVTLDAAGSSGGTSPVVIADAVKFELQQTVSTVIKDNDAGAPGYTETGSWTISSGTGYNGGTYRYTSVGAGKTAVWNLNLPSAGNWKISVIYKSGTNRATSAKYSVTTASGTQTAYVNQTLNDLAWVTLGTWSFNAGGGIVTLDAGGSTPTGKVVIADAVKAELQ